MIYNLCTCFSFPSVLQPQRNYFLHERAMVIYNNTFLYFLSTFVGEKARTARLISKYKPKCAIIAITRHQQTARQCHLYRGILPLCYNRRYHFLVAF